MDFSRPGEYWELHTQVTGPIPAVIAGLHPDEATEIRAAVEAKVERHRVGDHYAVPTSLVAVAAR